MTAHKNIGLFKKMEKEHEKDSKKEREEEKEEVQELWQQVLDEEEIIPGDVENDAQRELEGVEADAEEAEEEEEEVYGDRWQQKQRRMQEVLQSVPNCFLRYVIELTGEPLCVRELLPSIEGKRIAQACRENGWPFPKLSLRYGKGLGYWIPQGPEGQVIEHIDLDLCVLPELPHLPRALLQLAQDQFSRIRTVFLTHWEKKSATPAELTPYLDDLLQWLSSVPQVFIQAAENTNSAYSESLQLILSKLQGVRKVKLMDGFKCEVRRPIVSSLGVTGKKEDVWPKMLSAIRATLSNYPGLSSLKIIELTDSKRAFVGEVVQRGSSDPGQLVLGITHLSSETFVALTQLLEGRVTMLSINSNGGFVGIVVPLLANYCPLLIGLSLRGKRRLSTNSLRILLQHPTLKLLSIRFGGLTVGLRAFARCNPESPLDHADIQLIMQNKNLIGLDLQVKHTTAMQQVLAEMITQRQLRSLILRGCKSDTVKQALLRNHTAECLRVSERDDLDEDAVVLLYTNGSVCLENMLKQNQARAVLVREWYALTHLIRAGRENKNDRGLLGGLPKEIWQLIMGHLGKSIVPAKSCQELMGCLQLMWEQRDRIRAQLRARKFFRISQKGYWDPTWKIYLPTLPPKFELVL
jgi:hypothetical protein